MKPIFYENLTASKSDLTNIENKYKENESLYKDKLKHFETVKAQI